MNFHCAAVFFSLSANIMYFLQPDDKELSKFYHFVAGFAVVSCAHLVQVVCQQYPKQTDSINLTYPPTSTFYLLAAKYELFFEKKNTDKVKSCVEASRIGDLI